MLIPIQFLQGFVTEWFFSSKCIIEFLWISSANYIFIQLTCIKNLDWLKFEKITRHHKKMLCIIDIFWWEFLSNTLFSHFMLGQKIGVLFNLRIHSFRNVLLSWMRWTLHTTSYKRKLSVLKKKVVVSLNEVESQNGS